MFIFTGLIYYFSSTVFYPVTGELDSLPLFPPPWGVYITQVSWPRASTRSSYQMVGSRWVKGTVSRDLWPFLWLKRLHMGPIRTGKNGFVNYFIFTKKFVRKVRNSRVRLVDYEDTELNTLFHIFKLLPLGAVCKNIQVIFFVRFKVCEKPSNFAKPFLIVQMVTGRVFYQMERAQNLMTLSL